MPYATYGDQGAAEHEELQLIFTTVVSALRTYFPPYPFQDRGLLRWGRAELSIYRASSSNTLFLRARNMATSDWFDMDLVNEPSRWKSSRVNDRTMIGTNLHTGCRMRILFRDVQDRERFKHRRNLEVLRWITEHVEELWGPVEGVILTDGETGEGLQLHGILEVLEGCCREDDEEYEQRRQGPA
ncbi:hypothetical protein C8Q79DRAFT_1007163 [Trametes meyenii]|nr:hypothetical protein C8Q79DRAFT_1007163 [Trametes meyenii]